jgi:CubicO group peptidase (beta-lactamase class C family)
MTKVFTSTLIFYLQEKGFLNINDKVTKYIKLPTLSDTVKIKDLLSHNSGIRDKEQTKTFQDLYTKNQGKTYLTSVSLKNSIFTEDKGFVYSNTNYIILGEIIKNITGKTFNEYVDEIIVKKL